VTLNAAHSATACGPECHSRPGCSSDETRRAVLFRDFETKPVPSDIDKDSLIRLMARAIREHEELIEKLKCQLNEARRQLYGSTSEKVPRNSDTPQSDAAGSPEGTGQADPGQASSSESPSTDQPAAEGQAANSSRPEWTESASGEQCSGSEKKKRKGHGRNHPPAYLQRETETVDLPDDEKICPICKKPLREMGTQDAGSRLEYRRAAVVVITRKRKTYACSDRTCPQPPRTAPLPTPVIDKGMAEAGMLAFVLVSKFHDHLPLCRVRKILRRHGADVATSTLGGWAAQAAKVLKPLYQAMVEEVLDSRVIGTDDTPVRLLGKAKGKTVEGRIWAYLGDRRHPYVVFEFTPHHRQEAPLAFLAGYEGYLQADAYPGYDVLYESGKIYEVGCNAHARRKYEKALKAHQMAARAAIDTIRELYDVEEEAKDLTAEERKALREAKARPILERHRAWLEAAQKAAVPKSVLGNAIGYSLRHWKALARYLEDGDLAIDNNAVERLLRIVAIGRKNWLFFGSENGGCLAAIIYSVIQSALINGVEPTEYLEDVLTRIRTHPRERIDELLPDRWKAERDSKKAEAKARAQAQVEATVEAGPGEGESSRPPDPDEPAAEPHASDPDSKADSTHQPAPTMGERGEQAGRDDRRAQERGSVGTGRRARGAVPATGPGSTGPPE